MSTTPSQPNPKLTAGELAELIEAFNGVTGRLTATHEELKAEVSRLTAELSAANQELERSKRLAALGQMAAGIAHEVRNPLGSIRLYAKMLVDDLADRQGERGIAEKIAKAATHLDGVVGDVLAFSREFRVRPQPFEAVALFNDVVESCVHPQSRVRVELKGGDTEVVGDQSLLQQAVVNLVRNAIEIMSESPAPPGGHVLTLAASPTAKRRGKAASVELSVSDTGPGVPPEIVERMFNPFFTTRETGTGLGLAIVHRIADAHGGAVRVDRTPGRIGARFVLTVPVSPVTMVVGGQTQSQLAARSAAQPLPLEMAS